MMSHRYALAAVMLAAFALPVAAQQTTAPPDTSKKTTTTTSNGAVTDTSSTKTEVAPSTGALPAMAAPTTGVTNAPKPEGQVTPHEAAKVDVKVAPSLANTVKISGDSAFAIARTSPDGGEISSADLEMNHGRLVYQVKMLHGAQGASEVVVDAMTGEILKDKKYGGLKALNEHADETLKLQNAKADSSNTKKP
jgi:uncharacterized membrane protein YkoI